MSITKIALQEVNQQELAALIGVTAQSIYNWKKDVFSDEIGPFPQPVRTEGGNANLYNWYVVKLWHEKYQLHTKYKDYITTSANPTSGIVEGVDTLEQAKVRKANADASLAEIDLAKAQGLLLPAREVEKAWSDTVLRIRAKLLTVPKRVSNLLFDGMTVGDRETVVEEEIRETLSILSGEKEEVIDLEMVSE